MLSGFTGWHALVLLVIVVLLFGATKLPGLAKSVGQSMKIFKNEVKSEEKPAPPADSAHLNETSSEVRAQTDSTNPSAKP
ncbi:MULTISPECIES: twin-arginine translocase TatA/TatE family subunit [Microbacteriaceae]|jgi:sec-independent protein translocase protein TatA|uniref:twin-arginine translocase TatA/TatE family subunit n=1 Tax=Microbacteriaceae TaxID=85023 RepID=UPI001628E3D0|nr:twin-arginine translocase TatA/TatE family subunit [Glaciihabitans sp. INWT7]QNE46691.1 twin-arginine translocase TatA/TatE family subunit [Glaciihabitans sp. INWT7]